MGSDTQRGYRYALSRPGVAPFTASGALARLPVAMIALAIVLLVSNTTGSYAYAGVLSAAFAVTAAIASIATSRWADRSGQTRVLRILAPANAALLAGFTGSVLAPLPRLIQVVLVIAAGATSPAVGSYVRARWTAVADGPDMLRVGFAWESILDELIFTIGPVLTTTLAFSLGLGAPLFVAAAFVAVGSILLSLRRDSQPPKHHASDLARGSLFTVTRTAGLKPIIVAAIGLGTLFGSLDVGVVAFTQQRGQGSLSGLVLAGFALSSMIVGIAYGARRWPGGIHRHAQIATVALVVSASGFLLVDSTPWLAVFAFTTGGCVAPALIAIFTLTQRLVSPAHLTEGLTWTNSGLALGFAFGSATAGWLIDSFEVARAGFVMAVFGAGLSSTVVWVRGRVLATATDPAVSDPPPPSPAWNDDPLPGPHIGQ